MVILDEPYVSSPLLSWLEESHHAVLDNGFARALASVDPAHLPLPVVLKPAVGFCSMGVYVIEDATDWEHALSPIAAAEDAWARRYPQSVVDTGTYLVESYLSGTEYALDAYFDEEGSAHLLNVFRHDFANAEDTSDRLYLVNADIIKSVAPAFKAWLDDVNLSIGAWGFLFFEAQGEGDPQLDFALRADLSEFCGTASAPSPVSGRSPARAA